MIISRTPLRISFAGGGSDLPSFYEKYPEGGAVVSTAINKYIYIAVNEQFDGRIIINYSKTEIVREIGKIENNLVREGMKSAKTKGGIHINSIADIPSEGSGLGSSSSYIVGLLNALNAYKGKHTTAEELAKDACKIEITSLKKPVGKQDQYIAAYGGFNYIQFKSNGNVYVDPIICQPEIKRKLEKRLMLFYTGITRSSNHILSHQSRLMKQKKEKMEVMKKMVDLANELRNDINKNSLASFGEILHENWILKKQMSHKISSTNIDKWYEKSRKAGAIGGKLLGAGGGGFLLLYAREKDHAKIRLKLKDLKYVPFAFEQQGSKIIFIDNN